MHLNVDDVLRRVREADGDVVKVLGEFASGAFDGHDAGFDVDFDCWRG